MADQNAGRGIGEQSPKLSFADAGLSVPVESVERDPRRLGGTAVKVISISAR